MKTKIIILGCGSSIGTPVIGCNCNICISPKPKNTRLRSSILIQYNNKNILIDAGPDVRQQLLRKNINKIDAVIFTHKHTDHIIGAGELQAISNNSNPIPIYGNTITLNMVEQIAEHLFLFQHVTKNIINEEPINICDIGFAFHTIQHGKITNIAVSITINNQRLIYLNDISDYTTQNIQWLNNCDHIILDAKEYYDSTNHFGFPKANKLLNQISYKQAYFINMSHNIDYYNLKPQTIKAQNAQLCYDGMEIIL